MMNRHVNIHRHVRSYFRPNSMWLAILATQIFGAWAIYYWTERLLQQPILSAVAPLFVFVVIVSFRPSGSAHYPVGRANSRHLL